MSFCFINQQNKCIVTKRISNINMLWYGYVIVLGTYNKFPDKVKYALSLKNFKDKLKNWIPTFYINDEFLN